MERSANVSTAVRTVEPELRAEGLAKQYDPVPAQLDTSLDIIPGETRRPCRDYYFRQTAVLNRNRRDVSTRLAFPIKERKSHAR